MTADDVMDQIKTLDPQERAKVLDLLLKIETTQQIVSMDDQNFERAADQVLERHADLLRKLAQ
jgi:23S rRNA maturation-related 3'-5' exoribonuclease YhaM